MRVSILTWSIFMLKLGLAVAQNGQDVRTIQSSFVLISVAASNLDAAVRVGVEDHSLNWNTH